MPPVAIAFGSNMGDRRGQIEAAIDLLLGHMKIDHISRMIETEPMYFVEQPPFLNGVFIGQTDMGPLALLNLLKCIEEKVGRQTRTRNGPREIDLDIVTYGSAMIRSSRLIVPHPRLPERKFVLEPLTEIAPDWLIPGKGTARNLLDALNSRDQVLVTLVV